MTAALARERKNRPASYKDQHLEGDRTEARKNKRPPGEILLRHAGDAEPGERNSESPGKAKKVGNIGVASMRMKYCPDDEAKQGGAGRLGNGIEHSAHTTNTGAVIIPTHLWTAYRKGGFVREVEM